MGRGYGRMNSALSSAKKLMQNTRCHRFPDFSVKRSRDHVLPSLAYPHPKVTPRFYLAAVEKSGEGLGTLLRHRPDMVDSVGTNRVHITY